MPGVGGNPTSSGGSSAPLADNTALVKNNSDATKLFKILASGVTTGNTITLTISGTAANPGFGVGSGGLLVFGGNGGNSLSYTNGVGPVFGDIGTGDTWGLDLSGLGDNRTVIVPDASGVMVLTTAAQTLASKTLTTPTIASLTNAQHNHTNAAGGGLLAANALGGFELSVATQFDKAANTTLAAITGLTASLAAATKYGFQAVLHIAADAVGGHKYSIDTSDTLTATTIVYQVNSINNGTNAFRINSRQTAIGGSVGEAVGTGYFTAIEGYIQTNAAGTFEVRFAQNSASGTSSVLVGSICRIWKTS